MPHRFPTKSMQPSVAAQLVRNMHQLDANPRQVDVCVCVSQLAMRASAAGLFSSTCAFDLPNATG